MTFDIEQQMIMGIQPPAQGPSIKVNRSKLDMEALAEKTATATFTVKGQELSSDITLTLNDESGVFSIDATSVAVDEQEEGKVITVTYAPMNSGNHAATITLSNPGADDKTVTINGTAILETYAPVMLPADSSFINLTEFRADWTDLTPAKNVESYTLEVSTRPAVELLDSIDGSIYPGSYENITLPAPWESNDIRGGHNAVYFYNYSYDGYISYTVPEGYNNDVFSLQITTVSSSYGSGNLTVGSTQTPAVGHEFSSGVTHTWLVTASSGDKITITTTDDYFSPDMAMIKVYLGDVNELNSFRAVSEDGEENYRLIPGITDMFCTVKNLAEAGTFHYRVKATYADGTIGPWSNTQQVTLFENEHSYAVGDVNHDGGVNIADVSDLIDGLLSGHFYCETCADVDGSGSINIADVSELIDILLRKN